MLFTLPFSRMRSDIQVAEKESISDTVYRSKAVVRCESFGVAFPRACLNWRVDWSGRLRGDVSGASLAVVAVQDGLQISRGGHFEVTLQLHHFGQSQPLLFLLSANSALVEPDNTSTIAGASGRSCTVAQYWLKLPGASMLRVNLLPGSAVVCEKSVLTIREHVVVRH
ncbi:hypothetical protein ATCC90586_004726 [Pythium insidiosum]|nr:hypothetical protein ATCC90586_004726 [Pythium insidiosum]